MCKLKINKYEMYVPYLKNLEVVQEKFDLILSTCRLLGYDMSFYASNSTRWKSVMVRITNPNHTIYIEVKCFFDISIVNFRLEQFGGKKRKFTYKEEDGLDSLYEKLDRVMEFISR